VNNPENLKALVLHQGCDPTSTRYDKIAEAIDDLASRLADAESARDVAQIRANFAEEKTWRAAGCPPGLVGAESIRMTERLVLAERALVTADAFRHGPLGCDCADDEGDGHHEDCEGCRTVDAYDDARAAHLATVSK
jgi:hypothetical protein